MKQCEATVLHTVLKAFIIIALYHAKKQKLKMGVLYRQGYY